MRLGAWLLATTLSISVVAPSAAGEGAATAAYDPMLDGPAYVYSDTGAALSDDGSHYCFKDDTTSPDLLRMMSHGCRTGWGMPGLRLGELWWDFAGLTTTHRKVSWRPWGWQETARVGGLTAVGRTYFEGTDRLASSVTLTNPGTRAVTLTPRLGLQGRPTFFDARDPSPSTFVDAQASLGDGALELQTVSPMTAIGSTAGPTAAAYRENRVFRTSPAVASLAFTTGVAEGKDSVSRTYDGTATLRSTTVGAGASTTVSFVSGWARDETPVQAAGTGLTGDGIARARALAASAPPALPGFAQRLSDWRAYFARLPKPHTTGGATRAFYLAATALRQNWYAPINKMTTGSIVPAKAFYDGFYAWDTPYNAIGYTDSSISQAEDALVTQLSVPTPSGAVPGVFGDDMTAYSHTQGPSVPVVYDDTQAPTQGLAVLRILERDHDGKRRKAFIAKVRGPLERYVTWWQSRRDLDHDLLIEVGTNDDASFYATNANSQYLWPTTTISPLVYNAYYNLLLQAVARLAAEQHDHAAAQAYEAAAVAHTRAMNAIMWDAPTHRWHTVSRTPGVGGPITKDSANTVDAGLVALYAAGQDPKLVRDYITHTLLDPKQFFGTYPFPTAAYDDPAYSGGSGFQGKLWLNEAEPMLELLWRYGYVDQARTAAGRLEAMLGKNRNGIYEAYNSQTGEGVRFWQFSWSSAFTLEMLLDRWQRVIDVAPTAREVSGYINTATVGGRPLYRVSADTNEVPLVTVSATGPLASAGCLSVRLDDPVGNLVQHSWAVTVLGVSRVVTEGETWRVCR